MVTISWDLGSECPLLSACDSLVTLCHATERTLLRPQGKMGWPMLPRPVAHQWASFSILVSVCPIDFCVIQRQTSGMVVLGFGTSAYYTIACSLININCKSALCWEAFVCACDTSMLPGKNMLQANENWLIKKCSNTRIQLK